MLSELGIDLLLQGNPGPRIAGNSWRLLASLLSLGRCRVGEGVGATAAGGEWQMLGEGKARWMLEGAFGCKGAEAVHEGETLGKRPTQIWRTGKGRKNLLSGTCIRERR